MTPHKYIAVVAGNFQEWCQWYNQILNGTILNSRHELQVDDISFIYANVEYPDYIKGYELIGVLIVGHGYKYRAFIEKVNLQIRL